MELRWERMYAVRNRRSRTRGTGCRGKEKVTAKYKLAVRVGEVSSVVSGVRGLVMTSKTLLCSSIRFRTGKNLKYR